MKIEHISTDSGVLPVLVPNKTEDGVGFYVSYNDHDISIYGSDTTALVVGQMEKFYILDGDHRSMYSKLIGNGFDACLEYFLANIGAINKYSAKIKLTVG